MKNKSVQNCRIVHHAKFHCIVTTLKKFFKIEFEGGGGLEKSLLANTVITNHASAYQVYKL